MRWARRSVTIDRSIPQEDGHHERGLIVYLTVSIFGVTSSHRTSQSYEGESAGTTCDRWSAPCTSAPPAALLTDFHDYACWLTALRRQSPGRAPRLHTIAGETVAAILDAQYGFPNIVRHRKPSASKPASPEPK
jgi:hypothetical protein